VATSAVPVLVARVAVSCSFFLGEDFSRRAVRTRWGFPAACFYERAPGSLRSFQRPVTTNYLAVSKEIPPGIIGHGLGVPFDRKAEHREALHVAFAHAQIVASDGPPVS